MQDKIKILAAKVDALTLRERMLVFLAILVGLFQAWDSFVWSPMMQRQEVLNAQEQALNKEMLQMQIDLKLMTAQAVKDPDQQLKLEIVKLEQQLAVLNEQIQLTSSGMVTPEQMAVLLEEMLLSQNTLQLLRLETHDSVPLIKAPQNEQPIVKYQIYRHDFSIEFKGGYLATLSYLEALENLDTKFFWEAIEFGVGEFPDSKVHLKLYTLSLSESWIGV